MRRCELDGPPWGTCVDPDEAYLRGQAGQVGSGLLGGWGEGEFGGPVDARPRARTEDEVREEVGALIRDRDRLP